MKPDSKRFGLTHRTSCSAILLTLIPLAVSLLSTPVPGAAQHPDMTTTRVLFEQKQICLPCPNNCLHCDGKGTEPSIKAGYSLSPSGRSIQMVEKNLFEVWT